MKLSLEWQEAFREHTRLSQITTYSRCTHCGEVLDTEADVGSKCHRRVAGSPGGECGGTYERIKPAP